MMSALKEGRGCILQSHTRATYQYFHLLSGYPVCGSSVYIAKTPWGLGDTEKVDDMSHKLSDCDSDEGKGYQKALTSTDVS